MKIYVVRHGQSNYNVKNLCNSDPSKDVHLTELGIKQAETVSRQLKDNKFDIIIVSELKRTRQTAEIINRHHDVEIIEYSGLNDRKTGFDSKPASEFFTAVESAQDPLTAKFNDGESFLEEKSRIFESLCKITKLDYESVLIVSHSEVMSIINGYFRDASDADIWGMDEFKNTEVIEFNI